MITLGTTLFSLTNEWRTGVWTLDALLDRFATEGLGPGLEAVGFQTFRDFPHLRSETVQRFRRQTGDLHLEPTALGVYVDHALRRGDVMPPDVARTYLLPQLDAATALGFPVLRATLGLEPALLKLTAPDLERRSLTLTVEVQGATTPESPELLSTLEVLDRLKSPALGLTLDFSVAMAGVPVSLLRHLRERGFSEAVLTTLCEAWAMDGPLPDRFGTFAEAARAGGVPDALIDRCFSFFLRFGHSPPDAWTPVLPYVRHVHAKYWDLEEAPTHMAEPDRALLQRLVAAGYDRAVSSEWGGSDWLETADADAFELTARHLHQLRELLNDLGSAPSDAYQEA